MSIGNAGGGSLVWNAGENAPWLSLSAGTGAAPAQLVLTANPAGLGEIDGVNTTLHITATVSGQLQQVDIPVSLTFGDAFNGNRLPQGGHAAKMKVYLPLVHR